MSKNLNTSVRSISRRQFLHGDISGKNIVIRPPWSVAESLFLELCTACGDCLSPCPTGILRKGSAGYPEVDFLRGECKFCGECAGHCPTGALLAPLPSSSPSQQHSKVVPWYLQAHISEDCLAFNNVVCRSCAEQCEPRAIGFCLSAGRVPQPELDLSSCSGCGACYAPCPANAISFVISEP